MMASDLGKILPLNSTGICFSNMTDWDKRMEQLYFWFYLLLFIPGLCLNSTALWVLCRHIKKRNKAVIFMVNLALADLLHVLSLPLRIHYYLTLTWPFGKPLCLLCFYLKFFNMYASIMFLVCISVQRCVFLLKPFCARKWRERYDFLISGVVWLVVAISCSPFVIMRIGPSTNPSTNSSTNSSPGCFKDLPTRKLSISLAATMMVLLEMFGFVLPLGAISYCSFRIVQSLKQLDQSGRKPPDSLNHSNHNPHSPVTSQHQLVLQPDKQPDRQTPSEKPLETTGDKRRALRMVLSCSALFLLCFAPYHINFMLYLMVTQEIVTYCPVVIGVLQFHPVSLCWVSLSSCLNPLLYYFLTAEFRQHIINRTSSISSSIRGRLMSLESTSSFKG